MRLNLFFKFFLVSLFWLHTATAHEISPTIATFTLNNDLKTFELELEANAEALIAKIGAEHDDTDEAPQAELYKRLRALSPDELSAEFEKTLGTIQEAIDLKASDQKLDLSRIASKDDIPKTGDVSVARISKLYFSGQLSDEANQISWQFDKSYGDSVFHIDLPSLERQSEWLTNGQVSKPYSLTEARPVSFVETAIEYVKLGFLHILPRGLDHILFVIGLFLLSPFIRPLLWQVSAFTLAHTITIALGILGYVTISPSIVEPLIAASIILIALENLMTTSVSWWRTGVVFLFGLLHGLGFAGVLGEIGLPQGQFIPALVSFNIGVEIGQLVVLAACFLLVGLWMRNRPDYGKFVRIPGSILIGLVAVYWFLERTVLA